MAAIAESVATLRIFGDDLIPQDVSAALGAEPSAAHRQGEVQRTRGGREVVRKTGMWRLHATPQTPEDLDAQVAELLSRLTPDLAVWAGLSARFEVDLFCGLFMEESNEGFSLSAATLLALGERGIEIGLDVYAPSRPDTDTDTDTEQEPPP